MKKFLSFLMVLLTSTVVCKADYNFDDYIYPFGSRTYYSKDSSGKTTSMSQFSFESQYYDNFLVEETYIGMGMKSATTLYRYHIKDNAVVSDVQIYQDVLTGSSKYQDNITIFAFPVNGKPYNWTEIKRGEKYQCTSEYTYIMASGKYLKAIKISRDNYYTVGKEKHRVLEKTYWVEGYGRIISLVNWDGSERVTSQLSTYGTYLFENVSEISEEKYKAHMEYLKKKEEMEAKKREEEAILRKKIAAFNEANKPQSFEQKYPNYQQQVMSIIESHINKLDIIGEAPMVVTIASSNDIRIQNGAFSSAPIIGESIKEYIVRLLKDKKVQLDTLINPETNKSVEIPLVLKVDQIPVVETKYYSLDYKKGTWYEKASKKPFYRTSALESEIYASAEELRLAKRAKKINVPVNYISFNNKLFFQNVGKACARKD